MNVANTLSRCGSRMQHTVAHFEVLFSCAFVYPFVKSCLFEHYMAARSTEDDLSATAQGCVMNKGISRDRLCVGDISRRSGDIMVFIEIQSNFLHKVATWDIFYIPGGIHWKMCIILYRCGINSWHRLSQYSLFRGSRVSQEQQSKQDIRTRLCSDRSWFMLVVSESLN